jgi:hypothetical protein
VADRRVEDDGEEDLPAFAGSRHVDGANDCLLGCFLLFDDGVLVGEGGVLVGDGCFQLSISLSSLWNRCLECLHLYAN